MVVFGVSLLLRSLPAFGSSGDGLQGSYFDATISDPMADLSDYKAKLLAKIAEVASREASTGFKLQDDWSNFDENSALMNVLVDLRKVYKGVEDRPQAQQFFKRHFAGLVAAAVSDRSLEAACDEHGNHDPAEFMLNTELDAHRFLADAHGTHILYAERPHSDNRVMLMPTAWTVVDGSMKFKTARGTALCAISGDGKSQILDEANAELKGEVFDGHCSRSELLAVRGLAGSRFLFEKGGSAVAFKKKASLEGAFCGSRMSAEEASSIFNRFKDEKDGAKMDVSEYVSLFNPVSDVGRLTITRGDEKALASRLVLTMGIQRSLLHWYLPFTVHGESYRIDPVLSPIADKIDEGRRRANKTVDKRGALRYCQELVLVQIHKALPAETPVLVLDAKTKNLVALAEEGSHAACRELVQIYGGEDQASKHPMFSFLFGKHDGKLVPCVGEVWLARQDVMAWLNPRYKFRWVTHELDGRMAIKKNALLDVDRVAVLCDVERTLRDDLALYRKMRGYAPVRPVSQGGIQDARTRKRARGQPKQDMWAGLSPDALRYDALLLLWNHVKQSGDGTLTPETAAAVLHGSPWNPKGYIKHEAILTLFNCFSEGFGMVTHWGLHQRSSGAAGRAQVTLASTSSSQVLQEWTPMQTGARLERRTQRRIGGGNKSVPDVKFVAPGSSAALRFEQEANAAAAPVAERRSLAPTQT